MPEASQTTHGKAFEYACLEGLSSIITSNSKTPSLQVLEDESYKYARDCYSSLEKQHRSLLKKAGVVLANKLKDLEPRLINLTKGLRDTVILSIQPDARGIHGDVRDVLAVKLMLQSRNVGWQIGISCKHNHRAVKHQRVSPHIDIGKEWLSLNCDNEYWNDIKKTFNVVEAQQKTGKVKWNQIKGKDKLIYKPTMKAIAYYLLRVYSKHKDIVCRNFINYLLGKHDFYKAILDLDNETIDLEAFNFNDSLNKPADETAPISRIASIKYPSKFASIDFASDSNNTIEIIMNEGWQINMRVHNARTNIENSLKLDVQLVGVPPNLYREILQI